MKQTAINKFNFFIYYLFFRWTSLFWKLNRIKIYNGQETIKKIIKDKCSIARFGDGEFSLMAGKDTGFQKSNEEIINKLKNIIKNTEPGLLVGIPYGWKYPWNLKYQAFEYWGGYLMRNFKTIQPYLNKATKYYDSLFTRFYIDYRTPNNAKAILKLVNRIWESRNVCIIEGEYSRLGVGNNLFDNAKCIKRIICPSQNAFNVYDRIINEANKFPKDTLFLLALGMTATCLAYDLHIAGYQAIDIGHIDIEYEWFKIKAQQKVAIPGKYVAESVNNNTTAADFNELYDSQIVSRIIK